MTIEIPANVYGLTDKFEKIKIADTVVTAETVNGTISSIDNTADGVYQFFDINGNPIYNVQVGDRPYACRTIVPGSKEKYHIQPDLDPVGGTIFYIDGTADGTYEFFDADGNTISNVSVGDKPYAYNVITPGSKDKYYVYHDELYEGRWTYYKDGNYVFELTGTSTSIGSGKTNTETVMTKDSGAYITADSDGLPTIWYQLQQARNAKVGGCDDWFVPSSVEAEELRKAIGFQVVPETTDPVILPAGRVTGGVIAGTADGQLHYRTTSGTDKHYCYPSATKFLNTFIWSSDENPYSGSDTYAYYWDPVQQMWLAIASMRDQKNSFSVFLPPTEG